MSVLNTLVGQVKLISQRQTEIASTLSLINQSINRVDASVQAQRKGTLLEPVFILGV